MVINTQEEFDKLCDKNYNFVTGEDLIIRCNILTKGDIVTDGSIQSDGYIHANGGIKAEGSISSIGAIYAIGAIQAGGDIHAIGDIHTTGAIQAGGDIHAVGYIYAGGDIQAIGSIQSDGYIHAVGYIQVGGAIRYKSISVFGKPTKRFIQINSHYKILATDEYLKIGRKTHTYKEWRNFTDRDLLTMVDNNSVRWFKDNKEWLLNLEKEK